MKRGFGQGCPLSPYLFVLRMKLLSNIVRKHKEVNGIKVNGYDILLQMDLENLLRL